MSDNLGFLTVIDQSHGGLTGGYLVLNRAGRPLEFHCTVPLVPDKIQEILYGDTLQPFLYGEKIAQTLIQRSKLPVLSVLTNHAAVLPVQPLVSTPIVYVFAGYAAPPATPENLPSDTDDSPPVREISEELNESLKGFGIDNTNLRTRISDYEGQSKLPFVPGLDTGNWREIRLGNRMIAVPMETAGAEFAGTEFTGEGVAEEKLITEIKDAARTIDLLEPFTRIRRALDEARSAA